MRPPHRAARHLRFVFVREISLGELAMTSALFPCFPRDESWPAGPSSVLVDEKLTAGNGWLRASPVPYDVQPPSLSYTLSWNFIRSDRDQGPVRFAEKTS